MIPFNKPYLTGKEVSYIQDAVESGKISGNGKYTRKCQQFFQDRYGFQKCLLTTSCTDALEMSAILVGIKPGDEVIMPAYTFVSTANAFVLRGARIVFADSTRANPNLDTAGLASLVTARTRAIVPVHYAGIACDMDPILELAREHGLVVIEDAAQAIDARYKDKPLGSLGALAAFSFHETKNIIAGEGGMLSVNDPSYFQRSEIIWEKGTNRAQFFRGEVDKYGWVDIGSSFLPSEIISAFLYAQLENLDAIQSRRKAIWMQYDQALKPLEANGRLQLPFIPDFATNNGHLYYLVCATLGERSALIAYLHEHGVNAVFHYLPLQDSPFYAKLHDGRDLPNAARYADCLVRLPLFYELSDDEVSRISELIQQFYKLR
jgi:dTDP-4-amino-4,6-dideoxygalactose transaminase